jgi:hypothetical protein
MHKKLLFLSLCLLVGNLSCAETATVAPVIIAVPARAESPEIVVLARAQTCRDRVTNCLTIGNCLQLAIVAATTVVTLSSQHDCCAHKFTVGDTTSPEERLMDSDRALAKKNYPWFGDSKKFRAAYSDYRHDLHGDTCEIIPKSNHTMVCYNAHSSDGLKTCLAKILKNYMVTRSNTEPLERSVFEKKMQDLEQAGKDCVKKREFRYNPKSHGQQKNGHKGASVRRSGHLKQ